MKDGTETRSETTGITDGHRSRKHCRTDAAAENHTAGNL